MNRSIVVRVVLGLVVAAVLVAAGFALFNVGAAYGLRQAPEWAQLMGQRMEADGMGMMNGQHMGMMPGGHMMSYGRMGGWGWRPFGGFGFLSCLIPLFFIFLVFALVRGMFGWRRWGWHGGHGPHGWEQRGREKFDEWHKQAHSSGNEPAPSGGGEPTQPIQ